MTRRYEVVYIFDSSLEEEQINERLGRFHQLLVTPEQPEPVSNINIDSHVRGDNRIAKNIVVNGGLAGMLNGRARLRRTGRAIRRSRSRSAGSS